MKSILIALVILCTSVAIAAPPTETSSKFGRVEETTPELVPATDTDVWTRTVYLEEVTLSNITASAITCTILDKQSTPRALFKDVSIAANSTVGARFSARYMPSGVSWSCSSATGIVGYMRAKR